ncbi:hypothetical protein SDRG_07098 [Saprolegnia diclina VS20]|uniref:Uncharacterized protein n=1 Tax=Saprolegnia diclina (strain VS20) TaxID=1156394 RepID=T0RYC8_SAPDV|nr:hypothetical protein SDRG_07098 [Saprolegnia diclina VS20]EQC35387.1 hypothetical protein SDRG_07098 [Saprolegnia diclina VS20]|eukprot:XP_008611137.1 hypothetical protein SDRG_07098 [Saprolegnia diclina VS20]
MIPSPRGSAAGADYHDATPISESPHPHPLTLDESSTGVRPSLASIVLMQSSMPRATIPTSMDDDGVGAPVSPVTLLWYVVSSTAIGAVVICTLVFAGNIGMHFLAAVLVAILNYEMAWYALGVRHKILRPFQLYYEPDALAASRDSDVPPANARVWGRMLHMPAPLLSVLVALLASALCGGLLVLIQNDAGLGLDTGTFGILVAYITSTCFVAVIAAMFTPSAMDGAILLLMQAAFSVLTLNTLLDFRAAVNGNIRSIKLIDAGFALSIAFVPIVILRIVRSREVARTGVTLLLDLFTLQYVPSLLNVVVSVVQDYLNPDQLDPHEPPHYRLYTLILCFLVLWASDLATLVTRHVCPQRPPWVAVAASAVAAVATVALYSLVVVPASIPNLRKPRHFALAVLSAFVYHIGIQFVAVLRFVALPSNGPVLHSTWLVRLQYLLLFGFCAMLLERVEWPGDYSYTSEDVSNQILRMWQRIDNSTYQAYLERESKLNFISRISKLVKVIHLVPDDRQLKNWSALKLHQLVTYYGAKALSNATST